METTATAPTDRALAIKKKKALDASFFKKGIAIAALSSIMYALYTAFVTGGQLFGVWGNWFGALASTSLVVVFILPTIASGINDTLSAIWATLVTLKQGKIADLGRCIASKPGRIVILAAFIGGPIASAAYVIALSQAGTLAVPIAALNPAIGAILSRILYKQPLGPRVIAGIVICVIAGVMIGSTGLTGEAAPGMALGLGLALLAALCWGIEGCVGGYATCMIDSQIAINIRQLVSGIGNRIIVLPILTLVCGGTLAQSYTYVAQAFTDGSSVIFFAVSGAAAYLSFMSWYRANAMCGTALGMAINGTYTFTAPFATWIILGLVMGFDGYALAPIAWVAAIVNLIGIFLIAVNPMDLLKKDGE